MGTTWYSTSLKFLKVSSVHWFKQNKKGGREKPQLCKCWLSCLRISESEKHVLIIPGNHHLTDYLSFFYLFITPCLQMCGRCTDLFSDTWDRRDQCWYNLNLHFSCLGADGWTLPGNNDLHPLFGKHSG